MSSVDSASVINTISFEEIVKERDAKVRVTADGYLYAVDLVMIITGNNRNDSGMVLRRLTEETFPSDKFTERKMPGKGNANTKLVSFRHAIELVMVLPGKMAKETRAQFAGIIHRYMAGDGSLVAEIEANGGAGAGAVSQLAQATLPASFSEKLDDGEGTAAAGNNNKKKRSRNELLLEDLDIQERRLALDERVKSLKKRELELPLELMATCNSLVQSFGGWEQRDQVKHKAMVSNYVDVIYKNSISSLLLIGGGCGGGGVGGGSADGSAAVKNGGGGSGGLLPELPEYISIPMVVNGMSGLKNKSTLNYNRIGKIASDLFLAKHGMRPGEYYGKHNEINALGVMVSANDYRKEDEPLLRKAVEKYVVEAEEKKKVEVAKARGGGGAVEKYVVEAEEKKKVRGGGGGGAEGKVKLERGLAAASEVKKDKKKLTSIKATTTTTTNNNKKKRGGEEEDDIVSVGSATSTTADSSSDKIAKSSACGGDEDDDFSLSDHDVD